MPRINIYLVRHGETDWNVAGVVQGQKDTTLNETGRTQSMLAGDALRSIRFHFAFTSDLSRAREVSGSFLAISFSVCFNDTRVADCEHHS